MINTLKHPLLTSDSNSCEESAKEIKEKYVNVVSKFFKGVIKFYTSLRNKMKSHIIIDKINILY